MGWQRQTRSVWVADTPAKGSGKGSGKGGKGSGMNSLASPKPPVPCTAPACGLTISAGFDWCRCGTARKSPPPPTKAERQEEARLAEERRAKRRRKKKAQRNSAKEESSESSLTMLLMQESQCRSVWAYAVEHKGSTEEWLAPQVVEDLETFGLKEEKPTLKLDQEPSIVDVLREVARQRQTHHSTSLDHSGVGESDSNATI